MRRMVITITLVAAVGAVSAAETSRWVERAKADVRAGRGSYFDVVDTLVKNEEVKVLRSEARWLFVQTPRAKEGWIFESALAAKPVGTDSELMKFLPGESATSATAASAGAKGVYAQAYAKEKGFDYGIVQWVEANQGVSAADLERFFRDGSLTTTEGAR